MISLYWHHSNCTISFTLGPYVRISYRVSKSVLILVSPCFFIPCIFKIFLKPGKFFVRLLIILICSLILWLDILFSWCISPKLAFKYREMSIEFKILAKLLPRRCVIYFHQTVSNVPRSLWWSLSRFINSLWGTKFFL